MERVRKGDATRARILHEAATQASLRGLATVSLNDVAEAIGISKSGVFKHFESKEAMQQAVLEATAARLVEKVWTPALQDPAGPARLEKIFVGMLDWDEVECGDYGCLIQSATVEFDDQPGGIRDFLHDRQRRLQRAIERELRALRDPPLEDEAVAQAAFELRSYLTGFIATRRTSAPGEARRRAMLAFAGLVDRLERLQARQLPS